MSSDFPQSDSNHQISRASREAFEYFKPASWITSDANPNADYGFDLQVQVSPEGGVGHVFFIQLKGTTRPLFSADGSTLTYSLSRTTLNYYAQAATETMLVVVEVRFQANGKVDLANSVAYYRWVSEELKRLRGSRYATDTSTRGAYAIRIPTSQRLTPELDVVDLLLAEVRRRQATETLEDIAREALPAAMDPTASAVELIARTLRDDPSKLALLLGPFVGQIAASALSNPPPSDPTLQEALGAIKAGATELAERSLERFAVSHTDAGPALRAEYLSLKGKVAFQRAQRADALALFREALSLDGAERYRLSCAEVEFLEAIDRNDNVAIQAVATDLGDVTSSEGISLRVRVLTSLGQIEAAEKDLGLLDEAHRRISRLIVMSMKRDWLSLLEDADASLALTDLPTSDRVALNLIACRAAWQLSLVESREALEDIPVLPLAGLRAMDAGYARRAWGYGRAAMDDLAALGWPPNVELLASTFTAIACTLGLHAQAIELLRQAQARRPEYQTLNEHLELLAIATDDLNLALEANLRRGDATDVLEKRALHLFQLQRLPEVLEITSALVRREDATPVLALAVGRATAKTLGRMAVAQEHEDRLRAIDDGEFLYFSDATYHSISKVDGVDPRDVLREGLQKHPGSILLAGNLLANLREHFPSEAAEIPGLARQMRLRQELTLRDWEHVIRAHMTLGEGDEAAREASRAIERFGRLSHLLELLAVACEMQGCTGDAIRLLDEAIASGSNSRAVFRNHLALSVRLGHLDAAVDAIDRLLATQAKKEDRVELLRTKALLLKELDRVPEAYAVVQLIGSEVDRDSEFEEGSYLNLMLIIATLHHDAPVSDRETNRERSEAFTSRWPKSRIFQSTTLDDNGQISIDRFHDILDSMRGGDSRAHMAELLRRERLLKDNQIGVPFVLRSELVFHSLQDPFEVWNVMTRSRHEDRQFHLTIRQADGIKPDSRVLRDTPLLDLPALLVLNAIDAFELLFNLFQRIAIPRSIVMFISQCAHAAFPGRASGIARKILQAIDLHRDRIDQPSIGSQGEGTREAFLLHDFADAALTGRWVVYSDDLVSRSYIQEQASGLRCIDSVDLLRLADEQDYIEPFDVALKLERLNGWHVGLTTANRYLVAALQGALPSDGRGMTVSQRLAVFQTHEPFASLVRGIWLPGKNSDVLVGHISQLVADMLRHVRTDQDSAAAVWAFWASRVELMRPDKRVMWLPLVLSLMGVLDSLPAERAPRAISAFLSVIEAVSDPNKMSVRDQDRMIGLLGKSVAILAKHDVVSAMRLRAKIERVLVPGTHDGDEFASGFVIQATAIATDDNKRRSVP